MESSEKEALEHAGIEESDVQEIPESKIQNHEVGITATDRRLSAGEGRRIAVEYSMSIPVRLVSGSSSQILH